MGFLLQSGSVKNHSLVVLVHAFNPSTQEAEAGSSWVQDQPGLWTKFQDSQSYYTLSWGKKSFSLCEDPMYYVTRSSAFHSRSTRGKKMLNDSAKDILAVSAMPQSEPRHLLLTE